jgi:hypothetical protein
MEQMTADSTGKKNSHSEKIETFAKTKGGKRQGSGRKKYVPNKPTREVRAIIDSVAANHGGMETVIEKLFELVEGVTVREFDKKGVAHIYDKPPDAYAGKILLETRFGKPAQAVQLSGHLSFEDFLRTLK